MRGPGLRRLRRRLKLTQVQLAEQLGVHSNSVARWERDEVRITAPIAKLIALVAQTRKGQRARS